MSQNEKKTIRQQILEKRGKFFMTEDVEQASCVIMNRLKDEPAYQQAQTIMCFISFGTEVDTHQFIKQALHEGKRILVPYIASKKDGMKTSEIKDFSELEIGYFNILTPKSDYLRLTEERPDLVIVPGVAFSKDGYRIGYGGGFYDRYLGDQTDPSPRIAIGFQLQVVEQVPVEPFDIAVDKLITEQTVYTFAGQEAD